MVANRGRRKTRYQGVFHVAQGNLRMDFGPPGSGLFVSMNKTEKEIQQEKELKTFRKVMYLVERERLSGWRKIYLNIQGVVLTLVVLLTIGAVAEDDLSIGMQLINLLVLLLLFVVSFGLHFLSKLLLKWLQIKKRSGYKVDFAFKRERSEESVKI